MAIILETLSVIFKVLGSLVLFLFGMKVMSDGLQKASGNKLQNSLNLMTKNRFMGVLTGIGITALIQSSSATTVLIVSFSNVGLITLKQSIGVIMGANIGTTVTAWLISIASIIGKFSFISVSLFILAFSLPLHFSKKIKLSSIAEAITGLTIIFIGLEYVQAALPDASNSKILQEYIVQHFSNSFRWYDIILFVTIGFILTALIQSSSAVTAIGITLVAQGLLPFKPVAAIIIGSNIGTTITTFISSIGASTNAKQAAFAHFLFNFFGALWAIPLFEPFIRLTEISTAPLFHLFNSSDIVKQTTIEVSVFHTLFNLINTLLLIGFVPQFTKLIEKIIPIKNEDALNQKYRLKYIALSIQDTPELNLQNAKIELKKMTEITISMFSLFLEIFSNPDKKMGSILEKLKKREDYTDQMQEQITLFLQECSQENININTRHNINTMIRISHELENIGDSCFNLGLTVQKKYEGQITFCDEANLQLKPFIDKTTSFLNFIYNNMNKHISDEELKVATALEQDVDAMRAELRSKSQVRIQNGGDVIAELLYLDLIKHIEHIGDAALNIAQGLRLLR